jgi:hypothetical protein
VDNNTFLAGYGIAQALPGPLFSSAAYLGAAKSGSPTGWLAGLHEYAISPHRGCWTPGGQESENDFGKRPKPLAAALERHSFGRPDPPRPPDRT